MKVSRTSLPDVLLIEPDVNRDERGFLVEHYQARRYASVGIRQDFVQDNVSFSRYGVLRGLHLQNPDAQAKLVAALAGEVFDVAVDVRPGSPTFGQWTAAVLSGENSLQLYIPQGFAHGFCVTSETALVLYKCGDFYSPSARLSIRWDDPDIGIPWPVRQPGLSAADRDAPRLADINQTRLPIYAPAGP
jgi:dTDP-4-dehydrorhamnose 3,5-epimerase